MSGQVFKNFLAGAAITALRCVKLSAADTVINASAAADKVIGIASDVGAASGERQDVLLSGVAWAEAGAATALGDLLISDASGRVITATAAAGTNVRVVGIGIDAAGAAGDQIRVFINTGMFQG